MNGLLLFSIGYGLFFLAMMLVLILELQQEYRQLLSPPDANEASARRTLSGVVHGNETLLAPLSGQACVAWQLKVLLFGKMGWHRDHSLEAQCSVDFSVDDVHLCIDAVDFSDRFTCEQTYFGYTFELTEKPLPQAVLELETTRGLLHHPRPQRFQLREYLVKPGEAWTLAADAMQEHADRLRVGRGTLAPGSAAQVRRHLRWSLGWSVIGGASKLLIVPIAFILYASFMGLL